MDLTIKKKNQESSVVLILEGWLDTGTSPKLGDVLDEIDGMVQKLLLDFQGIEYISSAGIRMLIRAYKQMHAQSGELVLQHVRPNVLEILKMSRLDQKLTIE